MRHTRTLTAILSLLALAATAPLLAGPDLHVGLQTEPSFLTLLARALLALWGAFLLIAGRRFPRAGVGTFFLLAALPPAWAGLAGTSIPFALFLAWLAFCLGMLIYTFVPRLAMALALFWPAAALYVFFVISTGSFSIRGWLVLILAVAGSAFGAVFPKAGLSVLASALGTVLLLLALFHEPGIGWTAGLFAAGCLWQLAVFPLVAPRARRWDLSREHAVSARRRSWATACLAALAVLAAGWIAVALLAPMPDLGQSPHPKRIAALEAKTSLRRSGVLISDESCYYLSGRALPVALVAKHPGLGSRLTLLASGRSLNREVASLRAVKEPEELDKMRRAALITSKAFEDVAPLIRPGVSEGDVEKAILASFKKNGATGLAFGCIVGSGANATKPHYEANTAVMQRGLVVIDIGCSFEDYASDMTRTFPVAGSYTPAERELMALVEQAHDAARKKLRAGATVSELDGAARKVIKSAGFGKYFNHGIGHGVGLDVHDPSPNKLAAGMVVTIEPGIYVPAGSSADPKYWDLGVRIENTYIVTQDGCEQITKGPDIPIPLQPALDVPAGGETTSEKEGDPGGA